MNKTLFSQMKPVACISSNTQVRLGCSFRGILALKIHKIFFPMICETVWRVNMNSYSLPWHQCKYISHFCGKQVMQTKGGLISQLNHYMLYVSAQNPNSQRNEKGTLRSVQILDFSCHYIRPSSGHTSRPTEGKLAWGQHVSAALLLSEGK